MYPKDCQTALYYVNKLMINEQKVMRRRLIRKAKNESKQIVYHILEEFKLGHFKEFFEEIHLLLGYEYRLLKKLKNCRQEIYETANLYFSNHRIAVYTAIFGDYDYLMEPKFCPDNVDYYIFTDQNVPSDSKWQKKEYKVLLPSSNLSNIEKNRFIKMMPHLFFEEYEYSIYIDGNFQIMSDLTALVSKMKDFPIAMHMHKYRDCVYQEIDECIAKGIDNVDDLERHRTLLLSMDIPKHWGLLEACVIARRHHDPLCKKVMMTWWNCFLAGCRRDQIALIECLWSYKINPNQLGELGKSIKMSNYFFNIPHPGSQYKKTHL